jgi:hypothetical protein
VCVVSRECYDCTRAKQQQGCLPLKKFLRNERRNSGTDARQRNKSFISSYSVTCLEDAKQNYKISIFSAGLWLIVELDISYMQMRYITHMFPTMLYEHGLMCTCACSYVASWQNLFCRVYWALPITSCIQFFSLFCTYVMLLKVILLIAYVYSLSCCVWKHNSTRLLLIGQWCCSLSISFTIVSVTGRFLPGSFS